MRPGVRVGIVCGLLGSAVAIALLDGPDVAGSSLVALVLAYVALEVARPLLPEPSVPAVEDVVDDVATEAAR